jgi:hypothetical protein
VNNIRMPVTLLLSFFCLGANQAKSEHAHFPILACEEYRKDDLPVKRTQHESGLCERELREALAHPWNDPMPEADLKKLVMERCADTEANIERKIDMAKATRQGSRIAFYQVNRRAIRKMRPWFNHKSRDDGDWDSLFYGKHPTICEEIQNAPKP